MKTIFKYPLSIADEQIIRLPKLAEILTITNQYERSVLFAVVNINNEVEERTLLCIPTGNSLPDDSKFTYQYISTVLLLGGDCVFHFFEKIPI